MTPTAAIDIGTHSILLLIAHAEASQLSPITDRAETARLGEGLAKSGVLKTVAMERAIAILQDYAQTLAQHQVTDVVCFGTAALRMAQNSQDFCDRVQQTFGWPVRVLTGKEEAFYTFKGVMSSTQKGAASAIAIDIGGGSTEVIIGSHEGIAFEQSFPVGAVVLKDQFSIPGQVSGELEQAIATHLQTQFAELPTYQLPTASQTQTPTCDLATVFVTGGTATTLAALALKLTTYDIEKIDGYELGRDRIETVFNQLNGLTREERAKIPGMEVGRADIILPALLILLGLCDGLKAETITVTVRGARYGILLD